jgi:uncharacterized protein
MTEQELVEMTVAGLVLDPGSNSPIVILKDLTAGIALPIWIGLPEATAIASALKKLQLARPMTHDLLQKMVEELGGKVERVVIAGLRENTFIANLDISTAQGLKSVDCRPSDAIALAVRTDARIFVSAEVLAQAQVRLVSVEGEEGEHDFTSIEREKWVQILAAMDPGDFKYKM